jgi:excisionase family DNA binding protein
MDQNAITLDINEAASLMKAEADTVMQLARKGDLPGTKIGKSWVFMRTDVIMFLRLRIDKDTQERRIKPSSMLLGTIVEKPRHGRTKPRPLLPDFPH